MYPNQLPAMTQGTSLALKASNVHKHFGGLTALDDVSLSLVSGEVHGLIGPNGSGKTTMLNLLCGFYAPSSGQILLNSEDLTNSTIQKRAFLGIGRTFQKPRLLPSLSVLDNAMLGAWIHTRSGFIGSAISLPQVNREELELSNLSKEILWGVGLGTVLDRPAALLDHGQQRFLEIARALVMQPKFLLLDEPAGGLTGKEIDMLKDLIKVIQSSGIGVLLVEHHTDFVFRISDRVSTFNVGKMLKHGTPSEVRSDPEVIRVYLGA